VGNELVLRGKSEISTRAGTEDTGGGDGGNITIDTGVLAALEDSKINANAFQGSGGKVSITTRGFFVPDPDRTITASSTLGVNGIVEINQLDVDPTRGLTKPPTEIVDASNQITQNCPSGDRKVAQNEFIVTGRGGLPDNPNEMLSTDAVWTDLRLSADSAENRVSSQAMRSPHQPTTAPLVEASGWVIDPKGQVVLTATPPTVTPHSSWQKPVPCRRS
jgi:large exoprotein involved in heme utilization and adhesion